MTEAKVLADHDGTGPQLTHEHALDERRRRLSGEYMVERDDANLIDTERGETLKALVHGRDQQGRRSGCEHLGRMGIERHDGRERAVSTHE